MNQLHDKRTTSTDSDEALERLFELAVLLADTWVADSQIEG